MRPSTEVSTSFRVDCRSPMLSIVRLFGSEPGEQSSSRSEKIESRMWLPRIE